MAFSLDSKPFQHSLEDELFEMANLRPDSTGLPFVVWISSGMNSQHDVRIKVSRTPRPGPNMTSVALRPVVEVTDGPPLSREDLRLLKAWAAINWEPLLAFWEGRIEYTEDVIARLRRIEG
jgi:hypothetical protein